MTHAPFNAHLICDPFAACIMAEGSSSSKKRRLETQSSENGLVQTALFVVGFSPCRATLRLPRWRRFTKKYVAEQGTQLPKGLPHGHFEVIRHEAAYQVAVFRYSSTEGCRSTSSTQHSKLPVPTVRHKDVRNFTVEPNSLRVGCRYLYGYNHPYTVEEQKIRFGAVEAPLGLPSKVSEHSRIYKVLPYLVIIAPFSIICYSLLHIGAILLFVHTHCISTGLH